MTAQHGYHTLLAFDFGLKRTGVAVGQIITHTATPLETLKATAGGPDWENIGRLVNEWQPDALIVGLPLSMDGEETDMSSTARRFGNQLHGRYNLPVLLVDERLSSYEAEQRAQTSGKGKMADIDSLAAQLILETWLSQQHNGENNGGQ